MDMRVALEIKAGDFLNLVYMLSSEAGTYHGLQEDEIEELSFNKFTEYLEHKRNKKEIITLLTSK